MQRYFDIGGTDLVSFQFGSVIKDSWIGHMNYIDSNLPFLRKIASDVEKLENFHINKIKGSFSDPMKFRVKTEDNTKNA